MKYCGNIRTFMTFSLLAVLGAGLAGCVSSPARCTASAGRSGYFCYEGINFGKINDPLYKEGVRDGCRTGKGYFRKNYRLSGNSESYRRGWDKGRAACRPSDWSDSPTYSYHPLPDSNRQNSIQNRETRYLSASQRTQRYSAENPGGADYPETPSRFRETPETIIYEE